MERNSLCRSFKDHRACNSNNKLKDSWNYISQKSYEGDQGYLSGFSWPPRSYTCSFCKREFRSAQALGGHMNVHRRDRARLRQSPPRDHRQFATLNLNLSPNPNPSFSPPLPSLVSPPLSALSSPSFASPSEIEKWAMHDSILDPLSQKPSDLKKMRTDKSFFDAEDLDGFMEEEKEEEEEEEEECKFLRDTEIVGLDLEIGLLSDAKADLDLELRLGYS